MLLTIAATDNGCLLSWATSFALPEEHLLKKNSLLTTFDTLTKEWKISFDFNPKSYKYKGYAQIIHFTTGGKGGKVGDQTPALWTLGVYIVTTLNGKPNIGKTSKKKKKTSLNKWTTVEISQVKKAA